MFNGLLKIYKLFCVKTHYINLTKIANSLAETPSPSIRITGASIESIATANRNSQAFFGKQASIKSIKVAENEILADKRRLSASSTNSTSLFSASSTGSNAPNRSSSSSSSMFGSVSTGPNSVATTPTLPSNSPASLQLINEEKSICTQTLDTESSSQFIDVDNLIKKVDNLVETDV